MLSSFFVCPQSKITHAIPRELGSIDGAESVIERLCEVLSFTNR